MAQRVRWPRPKIRDNSGHRRSPNVAAQQLPSARFTDCPITPVVSRTEEVADLPRSLTAGCLRRKWPPDAGNTPFRKVMPQVSADSNLGRDETPIQRRTSANGWATCNTGAGAGAVRHPADGAGTLPEGRATA